MKREAAGVPLRSRWGLFLGPASAVAVALMPLPGLSPVGSRAAGVASWMAVWWMTEAIPIPVTSLLPLVCFPIAGIASSQEAATPYANHLIFLFMGGFFIARTMQRWGLHRRIALKIVLRVGTGPRRLVLGVMLATAGLSMWISNTATTVMMLPIATALIDELRRQRADEPDAPAAPRTANEEGVSAGGVAGRPDDDRELARFGTALMLGIAYAASIGGVATLIGTPPNLVFAAMAQSLVGGEIEFLTWMAVGLPVAAALLPACWIWLTRWAHPVPRSLRLDRDLLRRQLEGLGPMDKGEKAALAIFVATATAWVIRSEKAIGGVTVPGIETFLPEVSDATVAMAGALAAFCVPLALSRGRFALDWETARDIPWGVLILFGGGLSLAGAFQSSGLSEWIAGVVVGLEGLPPWMVVAAATTLVVFLTELTSNTATATLAMPVFASAAVGLGFHPYSLMAAGALASSMAFMLPVATPPNAIVFGSGLVTVPQMARAGLVMNFVSILVATLAAIFLVPAVLVAG